MAPDAWRRRARTGTVIGGLVIVVGLWMAVGTAYLHSAGDRLPARVASHDHGSSGGEVDVALTNTRHRVDWLPKDLPAGSDVTVLYDADTPFFSARLETEPVWHLLIIPGGGLGILLLAWIYRYTAEYAEAADR